MIIAKILIYKIETGDEFSYKDPNPREFSNNIGKFSLSGNKLEVELEKEIYSLEEARGLVEAYLRDWVIYAEINNNPEILKFKYLKAELLDLDSDKEIRSFEVAARQRAFVVGYPPTVHITISDYPDPPERFISNPNIKTAHQRWLGYKRGEENILSAAYFIYTILLLDEDGNRISAEQVAKKYKISKKVLNKLTRISSTRGDEKTARKAQGEGFEELSDSEKVWLDRALRLVIRRMGEKASGLILENITMNDLPPLDIQGGHSDG